MTRDCKLAITARADSAHTCLDTLRKYCFTIGFNTEECFHIEVVLAEVINNIVEHALLDRPDEFIKIRCSAVKTMLVIEVLDNGKPLLTVPKDTLPDWDAESGRGWPIIYSWMDEVTYCHSNHQNQLVLKKSLPTN